MNLPGFTDLGLAAVVLVLAIVPAALLVLAGHGAAQALRLDERMVRLAGRATWRALTLLTGLAVLAVCLQYSWRWSAATHLKPLCATRGEPWFADDAVAMPVELRVTRQLLERNYWLRIEAEQYAAVGRDTGELRATAAELWVDAAGVRYACGVVSGPFPRRVDPTAATPPAPLRRFLARAGRPGGAS
jgi:hypothetical protein